MLDGPAEITDNEGRKKDTMTSEVTQTTKTPKPLKLEAMMGMGLIRNIVKAATKASI